MKTTLFSSLCSCVTGFFMILNSQFPFSQTNLLPLGIILLVVGLIGVFIATSGESFDIQKMVKETGLLQDIIEKSLENPIEGECEVSNLSEALDAYKKALKNSKDEKLALQKIASFYGWKAE